MNINIIYDPVIFFRDTHTYGYIYTYVKSQKQNFGQKRGRLQNDIFNMTIYMKVGTQYLKILMNV